MATLLGQACELPFIAVGLWLQSSFAGPLAALLGQPCLGRPIRCLSRRLGRVVAALYSSSCNLLRAGLSPSKKVTWACLVRGWPVGCLAGGWARLFLQPSLDRPVSCQGRSQFSNLVAAFQKKYFFEQGSQAWLGCGSSLPAPYSRPVGWCAGPRLGRRSVFTPLVTYW